VWFGKVELRIMSEREMEMERRRRREGKLWLESESFV
jgi:hypothetical protein